MAAINIGSGAGASPSSWGWRCSRCPASTARFPALAQSEKPVEVKRPELQTGNAVRYDEDWSVLRGVDLSKTDDFWDRVKFIPLNQDQSVWLSLGGQVRQRLEYFNQFKLGAIRHPNARMLSSRREFVGMPTSMSRLTSASSPRG